MATKKKEQLGMDELRAKAKKLGMSAKAATFSSRKKLEAFISGAALPAGPVETSGEAVVTAAEADVPDTPKESVVKTAAKKVKKVVQATGKRHYWVTWVGPLERIDHTPTQEAPPLHFERRGPAVDLEQELINAYGTADVNAEAKAARLAPLRMP